MPDAQVLPDLIAVGVDTLPPALECSSTDADLDAAWVRLVGELDVATVPQLERTLREPRLQARLVVLDLRELVDVSGVRAIVNDALRARQAGRRLVLLRGPATVDRMLTLAGSSDDLEIGDIDQVEPAVAALLQLVDKEPRL